MIVEIRGTGFSNKGAELMLAAIVDRLGRSMPQIQLVTSTSIGPYQRRARYGLFQKFAPEEQGRMGWLIKRVLHRGYQGNYGLVSHDQIDAVLDASGFALGDSWETRWVEGAAKTFAFWRNQNKKVILLPQAFGPFERPQVRQAARRALLSADLIFARDSDSHDHVSNLVPHHAGVYRAPDFTNLVDVARTRHLQRGGRLAIIVPNSQMLKHGPAEARSRYVDFMTKCAEHLLVRGLEPSIVLHEERSDNELAEQISQSISGGLPIVRESCPLVLKGLIGQSSITIGSRFHGLVNALSQGIPSIGTSWSHKYRYLFEDYGRPHWLVDSLDETERCLNLIDGILNNREDESAHLRAMSNGLKEKSEEMWTIVEEFLASGQTFKNAKL